MRRWDKQIKKVAAEKGLHLVYVVLNDGVVESTIERAVTNAELQKLKRCLDRITRPLEPSPE